MTEHIEGDECKFALWTGTVAPISDYKVILRVCTPTTDTFHFRPFHCIVSLVTGHCTVLYCTLYCTALSLQAPSLDTKQLWVKRLRELIQERLLYISSALNEPLNKPMPPPPKMFNSQRSSRYVPLNLQVTINLTSASEISLFAPNLVRTRLFVSMVTER